MAEKDVTTLNEKKERAGKQGRFQVLFLVPGEVRRRITVVTEKKTSTTDALPLIKTELAQEFTGGEVDRIVLVEVTPLNTKGKSWTRPSRPSERVEYPSPRSIRSALKRELVEWVNLYELDVDTTQRKEAVAEDMILEINNRFQKEE